MVEVIDYDLAKQGYERKQVLGNMQWCKKSVEQVLSLSDYKDIKSIYESRKYLQMGNLTNSIAENNKRISHFFSELCHHKTGAIVQMFNRATIHSCQICPHFHVALHRVIAQLYEE